MFHTRTGHGPALLLVHGLGSTSQSWDPIHDDLAAHREVVAVDLPGHGQSPPLQGGTTFAGMVDAVARFIDEEGLHGIDLVGSSIGGRLVLELARRGVGGAVVALDPGGFWGPLGARYLGVTLGASLRLVRLLDPVLPTLLANRIARSAVLVQLSARPWEVPPEKARAELRRFASTPVFEEVLRDLVHGPVQAGMPAGAAGAPIVLVWGRRDRVTLPRQASRATERFPDAQLVWLDRCGHFPQWDRPAETVQLILRATGR